jgi:uncharacterized delta-60 repeat protein
MSGSRKRPLHVANALGLACVAATCFLVACGDSDDSSNGTPNAGAGGSSGKAGSGSAGKAGSAGKGGSGNEAGDENVAGEGGEGGEGGEAGSTAGTGGSTAGAGGNTAGAGGSTAGAGGGTAGAGGKGGSGGTSGSAGSGGISGSGGSGGAPPVLVPNCVRDTTSGKTIAISANGNDGLFGLTHAADGSLYATGYVQDGVGTTEDRSTVVVKIKADGTLDTTWASQGIAKVNVRATATGVAGLGEMPRGIAFQGDKIVVSGTVEAYTTAQTETVLNNDRDAYVLRLNANGTLDTTFGDVGTPGIHFLPLNTGTVVTNATTGAKTLSGADAQWGLNVLADKSIIVTAATRSYGAELVVGTPRSDTDFAVIKLTENGAQDTTFGLGASGVYTLDVANAGASVRNASILPDGKLIVTGYSTFNGTQRPVVFKLLANGSALDTSFGVLGVFSDAVGTAGEAYGALLQSDNKLVTVGYGRATAANTTSDFLSIRLTTGGLLDTTYGTTTGAAPTPGRVWFDVGGLGDNGRAMVLSDNRPVLLGGGSLSAGQGDAAIVLLSADGKPVTNGFGSPYGCTAYDFGSVGDFFWAGDVAADGKIAVVGVTGHGNGSTVDTDSTFLLINKP